MDMIGDEVVALDRERSERDLLRRAEEMRGHIRDLVRTGHTQSDIARQAGISGTSLSQFLHDKYPGNIAKVLNALEVWAAKISKGVEDYLPIPTDWVETPTGRRIEQALAFAQSEPTIVVIYGNPGIGKTTSIARFERANINVWVATCNPASGGLAATLQQVAGAVGLRGLPTTPYQLSCDIITRLRGTQGLLIVDESQDLTPQAYNQLRAIHDAAGVGLCLCGNEEVYSKVTGRANRAYFAQLASRIGRRLQLQTVSPEDVDAFLAPWGITGGAEVEYARQIALAAGGLRSLYQCLRQAAIAAHGAGRSVDVKLMRDARAALGADQ
jgi:DNA transposition AAA+ family ATPase